MRGPLLVALAVSLLAVACGRKSDPRPPELTVPRSPEPVVASNVAAGIRVQWRRPDEYVDGARFDDLSQFIVYRACEAAPDFERIAEIPVSDRDRFRRQRGFDLVDHDPALGVACRYRVFAIAGDGQPSEAAESATILRALPVPSPTASPAPSPRRTPAAAG